MSRAEECFWHSWKTLTGLGITAEAESGVNAQLGRQRDFVNYGKVNTPHFGAIKVLPSLLYFVFFPITKN